MSNLTKQDLEKMLILLDLTTLNAINSKYRTNTYVWGKAQLLNYTPEALREYADAIYCYILPHFGLVELTEEEYIAKWLAPETALADWLSSNERFISTLETIASNPIIDPNIIREPEYDVYCLITDFIQGDRDFYETTNDFLLSKKLRDPFIEDTRIIALVTEIDAMRDRCNKKLVNYIGEQLNYTEKTEKVINPKGKSTKESYRMAISSTIYGTELKRLRRLVTDRLAYINLNQADIDLITANRKRLPQDKVTLIEQALASETLSSKARTAITDLKKLINEATVLSSKLPKLQEISKTKHLLPAEDYKTVNQLLKSISDWNLDADRIIAQYDANIKTCMASADYHALCNKINMAQHIIAKHIDPEHSEAKALKPYIALAQQKDLESAKQLIASQSEIHAVTVDIHNLFIRSFALNVEQAYSELEPISIFALLDKEKDLPKEKVFAVSYEPEDVKRWRQATIDLLASKGYDLNWFSDYVNILSPLAACLNIVLNDLTPTPDALSHGGVVGMLEWCEQVKASIIAVAEGKPLDFDYIALANDLRDKMQYHTLASNTVDYYIVSDTGLTLVEGKSAEYIQNRLASLREPEALYVHNLIYGVVKVCVPPPLPEVYSTDDSPQLSTAKNIDNPFNLTKSIRDLMITLQPDTIFILNELINLTEDEAASLKPVPDSTLEDLFKMQFDIKCNVYLLRGDLIVLTGYGKYYRIIPKASTKNKNGKYKTYSFAFTAINWNTLNKLIIDYSNLLKDTDSYDEIRLKLEIRKNYVFCGANSAGGLAQRYKQYREDSELLSELKKLAEEIYTGTDKEALVYSMFRTHYKTYYISHHYLVKWVYTPDEYAQKLGQVLVDSDGNIINNIIHHKDKNPSNNDPDNLEILDKDEHDSLKGNSKPVLFEGRKYPSITEYNDATQAGAYTRLQQTINQLQPGSSIRFNNRNYALDAKTNLITATSIQQIIYNGVPYPTPADFAKAKKLSPTALDKKLRREKENSTESFIYKGFRFELEKNGTEKIIDLK